MVTMSSRRKRALPPWLQGVTVKKGVPVKKSSLATAAESTDQKDAAETKGTESHLPIDAKGKPYEQFTVRREEKRQEFKKNQPNPLEKEDIKQQTDHVEEKWSVEKAVEMSYKEFIFQGTIIYSHNIDDCNLLCDDIISNLDSSSDTVIGFDTEWPVTYEKGKQGKTSLIQICLSTSKCYLFHVSCMPKFPIMLRKLLENHAVKKVGLNIENDFWKLDVDYDLKAKDIVQKSAMELRTLGNKKLRSAENWSLEGLAKNVLRVRISKDPSVRKCDWRQFPLPEAQQRYTATDAIVSLLLYQELIAK
ncbi:bifunctional 3'-5' exonuclease/ATP-dependent helicase WRN-like [Mercenaria mercenaria]|uniref:bifunctional 3'-5' exonuclease/ATP-dependent helicase WRN-like n=1 Tax=Mercenaria mercenaria TaxID=6596 RepID=UPI00234E88A5|nr:bifunctional 3'-5' exonuclease/ATP-dependent helicase WRN-like [Mercenaria mercenaria]